MSVLKSIPIKSLFAAASVVTVAAAGTMIGATSAQALPTQIESYERASQSELCVAQPDQTPWEASWGMKAAWTPSWQRWANEGTGGWTCTRTINWAENPVTNSGDSNEVVLEDTTQTENVVVDESADDAAGEDDSDSGMDAPKKDDKKDNKKDNKKDDKKNDKKNDHRPGGHK